MAAIVLFRFLKRILCGSGGGTQGEEGRQTQHSYPLQQQQPVAHPGPAQKQHHPQQQQQKPPQTQQQQQRQYQQEQLQHHQRQQPQSPPRAGHSKPLNQRYDDNAVNQQNEHYRSLRARSHEEGEAMARCFRESQEAFKAGNGARAKELSNEGKHHQAEMERLNGEASDWIFHQNNLDSAPDEIDLHGLYVKEAIEKTEQGILRAQQRGDSQVRVIVGKGLHSPQNAAKLKPAIEELMAKHRLAAHLDPSNAGVLIVSLGGRSNQPSMSAGEITNRLENQNQDCVIM